MNILLIIKILKWILISLCLVSNNTLVWKIWRRKELHTIFNLGMCFFFLWGGIFAPPTIYDYGNLLEGMIENPDTALPDICHRILLNRFLLVQAHKVTLINIIFR